MRHLQITASLGCAAIICMGAGYAVGRQRADVAFVYDAVRLSVRASRPAPNKSKPSHPRTIPATLLLPSFHGPLWTLAQIAKIRVPPARYTVDERSRATSFT